MDFKELLVVIPHSGILIPKEISFNHLSKDFPEFMTDVDWYTNWLYDFRDIAGNTQIEFPYCSLILEANRAHNNIADSVPLQNRLGKSIYKPGKEPDLVTRQFLAKKYLVPFHHKISGHISQRKKWFMLDAHSTITSRGVDDNQIELMNYQISVTDNTRTYFCPDIYVETYANELTKLLPETKVTVNESRYDTVYGHICGQHSVNAYNRIGNRVPAILQETNQHLYMYDDGIPNLEALETLRRAFAEALTRMKHSLFDKNDSI